MALVKRDGLCPAQVALDAQKESSGSGIPLLPIDLLPIIFSNIRDPWFRISKRDLISCSEVSRAWRDFALDFLFAELSLGFYDELTQESTGSDAYNTPGHGIIRPEYPTLSILLRFLSHNPSISSRVHTLTLKCREYEKDEDIDSDFEIHYVSHMTLIAILRQLTRLRILKLYNLELVGPASAIYQAAHDGEQYPRLQIDELHLRYRERSGDSGFSLALTDVANTLNLFSEVKRLHLGNVRLRSSLSRPVDIPSELRVHAIVLDDVDNLPLLIKGCLPSGILGELKSLDTDFIEDRSLETLRSLLHELRTTITHFACAFVSLRTAAMLDALHQDFDALDLSSCQNLAFLRFHLFIYDSRTTRSICNSSQWACAIRMLSYLRPPSPNSPPLTVAFTIDTTPIESGTIAEQILDLWYIFADVEAQLLQLAECNKVTRVIVDIHQWGDIIHRDYASHIFPKLRANGILLPSPYNAD